MTHAWWHPFDSFQGDGGGGENMPPTGYDPKPGAGGYGPIPVVDPIAEILRKEDEEWERQASQARYGYGEPPPTQTLTYEERRRQILSGIPISQGGTLVTEDVVRGWKHENQIMGLFQQGIINEKDTKEYLYLWFANPELKDGTKHWPDRPSIVNEEEATKLSFDAYDGTIALWEATGQEIPLAEPDRKSVV